MLEAQVIVKVISPPSGNTVTLVIAVLGLVAALGSLLWQGLSYRLSGPRLKITLKRGYLGPGGDLISASPDFDASAQMAKQGLAQQLIGVEVTNEGRLPMSIQDATAKMENGASISQTHLPINPGIGTRIEPYSSENWWVHWEPVAAMASATAAVWKEQGKRKWDRPQKVRMVVRPAAGKSITTKEHIAIKPSAQ